MQASTVSAVQKRVFHGTGTGGRHAASACRQGKRSGQEKGIPRRRVDAVCLHAYRIPADQEAIGNMEMSVLAIEGDESVVLHGRKRGRIRSPVTAAAVSTLVSEDRWYSVSTRSFKKRSYLPLSQRIYASLSPDACTPLIPTTAAFLPPTVMIFPTGGTTSSSAVGISAGAAE